MYVNVISLSLTPIFSETIVALALFDLDNTLLNGDSDHAWGMFLADIGVLDPQEQKAQQDYFYEQYLQGTLDIYEFCEYQFNEFTKHSLDQLTQWHAQFMTSAIEPMITSGKASLLESHQTAGNDVLIVTATNDFVTAPIAKRLGVEHLLATIAEFSDGSYTGKVSGTPCFQEGKITKLEEWLNQRGQKLNRDTLADSYFYSDSINDLPLLELVDTPVAVTPDDRLRAHAQQHNWQIID